MRVSGNQFTLRFVVRGSRPAYFHFIPGQITFAYTAPPTRLLTNGDTTTRRRAKHEPKPKIEAEAILLAVNVISLNVQ